MKLKFRKNPNIKKNDYVDVNEFKFDKKTNIIPKTKNRLMCIFLSEEKECFFIFRKINFNKMKGKLDHFIFKGGMYIIDSESIFLTDNGSRVSMYMEGVSTPLKMSNIEKTITEVEYTDLYGNKQKSLIQKIKGLNFDAKILNTFANRKFAENFTVTPVDKFQLLVIILTAAIMILSIANIGVSYYFK